MIVGLEDGSAPIELAAGSVILLPRNPRHRVGSSLDVEPILADDLVQAPTDGGLARIEHGGGGAPTRFVCGYLACNRCVVRPLLEALPRLLRIPIGDTQASALLRELLRAGVRESMASAPGSRTMLAKLAELMLVEALRRHAESLPPGSQG
jgi:hypothetical protein